ncbi:6264_t:CDS:2, partial [Entrophospora sp. SA101]
MDTKSAKILMMKKNKVGNKEKLNKEANDYPGSFATTFTVDSCTSTNNSNNDFDIAIELFYFGAAPSIVDIA